MAVYQDIFDGPARNYRRDDGEPVTSHKKYITIHNTSNDASAEGEASYAKRRTDGTSSHYYVDRDSIVQSLDTDWCAHHVGSYQGNTYGISYEITGFNGWSRSTWLSNVAWNLLADSIARDCREFGIAVRLLAVDQMRAGNITGFITHDLARRAWGHTDHTDPGSGFPMDHLLTLVREHLGGDGDDDMSAQAEQEIHSIFQAVFQGGGSCGTWRAPKNGQPPSNSMIQKLDWLGEQQLSTLAAKLDALSAVIEQLAEAIRNGGGTVDTAAILRGVDERLAALRTAVETDTRDAVADAAEGGADAVRADA